jgi:hypothetical protein
MSLAGRLRAGRIPIQPRAVILLLILPVAFYVARSNSHNGAVTQPRAVEIAKHQIDYRPDGTSVRYVQRGLPPKGYWAVSLWQENSSAERLNVTVVLIEAGSSKVTQVSRNVSP